MSDETTLAQRGAEPVTGRNGSGGLAIAAIGFFMLVVLIATNMNC